MVGRSKYLALLVMVATAIGIGASAAAADQPPGTSDVQGGASSAQAAPAVQPALSFTTTGSLTGGDPVQTGRLTRNGVASTCASPKAFPGVFDPSGNRAYDKYTFVNASNAKQCVTVSYQLTSPPCAGGGAFGVAYSSFNPGNIGQNWLADGGSSVNESGAPGAAGPRTFSFRAKKHSTFDIVISAVDIGGTCNQYSLSVSGNGILKSQIPPLLADLESLVPGLHPHDYYHPILDKVHALQAAVGVSNAAACSALNDLWTFVANHSAHFSASGYAAFVSDLNQLSAQLGC
jgi:hypothetical protein